ncbi:GMC oxidoreductase [Aaosphaeria arxii CBS 175.79]|uniref:GMC oxidoreductase n=1 Tax=Aaosphaeria arxii CBS 175.79 TaxID=1450172 RepID=A0A6A5YB42_9PLEO|nr:GMC oxidoreductase [Aaosphaeria arxii CBS 175.79]KAF2021990.1 GMC oxidoreductase [Aaosphaeria arxii CBS 175.79]
MTLEEFFQKSYDYVIIGGGTAGLAVAARLSEDPNVTVAVLEAGGNRLDDVLIDAPNLFLQLWDKPEYDWMYRTVPQVGTADRVHGWVRGKVLGGSSAVNYNMFSMASRQDLNNWSELGNKGWDFDGIAPYYRKFEKYNAPSDDFGKQMDHKYIDPLLRGTDGPVQTELQWNQEVWPKTCLNAGYPYPNDPRTGSAIGGFNQLVTVDPKTVRRSYAARAYYEPNAGRPNLSLLTEALVEKIELDKTGSGDAVATGVRFQVNGTSYLVRANKEVIVSGGVINSPQILELSGIGGSDVLKNAGVDVLVDNPNVGENLNDHTAVAVTLQVKDEYPTAEVLLRNPEIQQQAMEAYLTHKVGPFANAPTTTGFASVDLVDPDLKNAGEHIASLVSEFKTTNPKADPAGRNDILARQLKSPKEAVTQMVCLTVGADPRKVGEPSQIFIHDSPGNFVIVGACSTRSLSRGSIHIESSDPSKHPRIDPNYYAHPLDLDMAARTVLHAFKLARTEPLLSHLKLGENGDVIIHSSWGKKEPKTLEEAKEFASQNTATEYHPIGTCAMLPKEKGGVVDTELRVYGTKNIRVIDASIFPTHVQGNIVSLVYAVAERAADIIKGKVANGTIVNGNGVNGHVANGLP